MFMKTYLITGTMKKCIERDRKILSFFDKIIYRIYYNSDRLNSKRAEQDPYNSLRGVRVFYI